MKKIVKAIVGAGLLISSNTTMTWVLGMLDWKDRVEEYGFFHELDVFGVNGLFWITAVFGVIGILLCVSALFTED